MSTATAIEVYRQESMEDTHSDSIRHAECLKSWLLTTMLYPCKKITTNRPDIQLESSYMSYLARELLNVFSVALYRPATTLYSGLKGEVRVLDMSNNCCGQVATIDLSRCGDIEQNPGPSR